MNEPKEHSALSNTTSNTAEEPDAVFHNVQHESQSKKFSKIIDWRNVLPTHDIQDLYSSSDQVWIAYRFFEAERVYWDSSQNLN